MRFFSLSSGCGILNQLIPGARSVSYKARINLASILTDIMSEHEPAEGVASRTVGPEIPCHTFALEVMKNGAASSGSVSVLSNLDRYLFNCGEGTQRSSSEHKFKMNKIRAVFTTYHSWQNIGGITGLCLMLRSRGCKQITIYGPPSIREIILGLHVFVSLKNMTIKIITDRPRLLYDDKLLKVQFVPIYPNSSDNVNKTTTDGNASSEDVKDDESDSEPPSPKRMCQSDAREAISKNELYSLCYICESPEYGNHFDVEKCYALGVPFGPLLGVLKNQQDVVLPNGKVVYWKDVLKPLRKSGIFIIVDCPTEDHLESFVTEEQFARFQGTPEKPAGLVVHFTPPDIMKNPKYTEWMSRFPPTTRHMQVNLSNHVSDHLGAYRLQEKLNFADPVIFPKLNADNIPEIKEEWSGKYPSQLRLVPSIESDVTLTSEKQLNEYHTEEYIKPGHSETENINGIDVIKAFATLRWSVIPERSNKFSHTLYLDKKKCLDEIVDSDDVRDDVKELRDLKASWESSKECQSLPEYPKILFLGTGSSVPSEYRNTSAILIEFEDGRLVMLDCGEGTYTQMLQFFGRERIRDILKRIRLIYVSHQHADHHTGIINILDARYKVLSECRREEYFPESESSGSVHLVMLLPPTVRSWVCNSEKHKYFMHDARILVLSSELNSQNTLRRLTNNLGITNFRTIMVPHSFESFGVSFVTPNGYKITYSGDTLPCGDLVQLGMESDLLIHEATFEDGMEHMAKVKKHCTIGQALDIGKRMRANFVMLTHFSQRYPHLPNLLNSLPENSGIAFDNMLVTPRTLPFLTSLMKLYNKIFADKINLLNFKTGKRVCRESYIKYKSAKMEI